MNMRDYATGIVLTAPSPADSGTSLVIQSGEGARMPDVPFYATVHPPSEFPNTDNSEKVKVTDVSADTLTIERGQGETSAQSIEPGWRLSNALFYKDVKPVAVTVSTGATTAAKVGATSTADYIPEAGDMLSVTFSSGINVNNPTLNIDSSGAKNIRLGNVNVSTSFVSTDSAVTIPMWYDGTYYNIYGSLLNTNTTYSEITEAEVDAGTASTLRTVSGRRMQYLIDKVITSVQSSVFLWTHPVGSIYMSVDSANPGIAYGGTWVAWGSGRVPVGVDTGQTEFNTVEKTGGAKTHTLTINEMPSHTHNFKGGKTSILAASDGIGLMGASASDGYGNWGYIVQGTGGGQAHNNLQPYITCYMFKRIS